MPKATTVNEFDSLMAEITGVPVPDQQPLFLERLEQGEPVAVLEPPAEPAAEAQPAPAGRTYRAPVEKVAVQFPGFPFGMTIAKEKGYLNILFSRFSKAFLYYAQIEALVRFCQTQGDEFLAYLKANGVK